MNNNTRLANISKHATAAHSSERGFTLFTTLILVLIVGAIAVSSQRSTTFTEIMAGNTIQRSRAFQAAEGGMLAGEKDFIMAAERRLFSSPLADDGVYSYGFMEDQWWRDDAGDTVTHTVPDGTFPGIVESPEYALEEIGNFVSDGGSGIVSLDRGSGAYGRMTGSGREVVLFRLQSSGVGSTADAKAVVESLYLKSQ